MGTFLGRSEVSGGFVYFGAYRKAMKDHLRLYISGLMQILGCTTLGEFTQPLQLKTCN